jgi:Rhodopirellula transposase DDE domain
MLNAPPTIYSGVMIDEHPIRIRFQAVRPSLDERGRRLHAAAEAVSVGRGGVAATARATKVARSTIGRGLNDLRDPASLTGRVRRKGGGRRKLTAKDPTLLSDLEKLLDPVTMGDPMRPLRWVSKSHAKLAAALRGMGHQVSTSTIPKLLKQLGYRRHVNRKTKDGRNHPDRDAQFEHINAKAREFQAAGQPVISVDTKKKELIGEYKNPGSDYGPKGKPIEVDAHDFENKELGKVVPYGIYDVGANSGYVSLGIDHDTAQFAVNATRRWIDTVGSERYPDTGKVMVTADCGGSNGSRVRLWKFELQQLADETGLIFEVCHYPPGTSSRVDDWRGGFSLPVGRWCRFRATPSVRTGMTPFPVAARQTGRADHPHPAFTCVIKPSRSAGRHGGAARHRGRASRRDTRSGIGDTRCPFVHCVAPTIVEGAVAHTNARLCRSAEPALG